MNRSEGLVLERLAVSDMCNKNRAFNTLNRMFCQNSACSCVNLFSTSFAVRGAIEFSFTAYLAYELSGFTGSDSWYKKHVTGERKSDPHKRVVSCPELSNKRCPEDCKSVKGGNMALPDGWLAGSANSTSKATRHTPSACALGTAQSAFSQDGKLANFITHHFDITVLQFGHHYHSPARLNSLYDHFAKLIHAVGMRRILVSEMLHTHFQSPGGLDENRPRPLKKSGRCSDQLVNTSANWKWFALRESFARHGLDDNVLHLGNIYSSWGSLTRGYPDCLHFKDNPWMFLPFLDLLVLKLEKWFATRT